MHNIREVGQDDHGLPVKDSFKQMPVPTMVTSPRYPETYVVKEATEGRQGNSNRFTAVRATKLISSMNHSKVSTIFLHGKPTLRTKNLQRVSNSERREKNTRSTGLFNAISLKKKIL